MTSNAFIETAFETATIIMQGRYVPSSITREWAVDHGIDVETLENMVTCGYATRDARKPQRHGLTYWWVGARGGVYHGSRAAYIRAAMSGARIELGGCYHAMIAGGHTPAKCYYYYVQQSQYERLCDAYNAMLKAQGERAA